MASVVRGARSGAATTAARRARAGAMVVEVSRGGRLHADAPVASIEVRVGDPGLRRAIEHAVVGALRRALGSSDEAHRWVELRTRRRAEHADVRGAFVVVRLSRRNAPHLAAIVATLEARGARGVQIACDEFACDEFACDEIACDQIACDQIACDQIACDEAEPLDEATRRRLFALLEARRGTTAMPVLLAPARTPLEALERLATAARAGAAS